MKNGVLLVMCPEVDKAVGFWPRAMRKRTNEKNNLVDRANNGVIK
jgi:hypothetical protein